METAITDRILSVGALTLDTIYEMDRLPDGPGKFLPISARENVSGMASNAATGIARLGGEVALWAAVGRDAVGDRLVAAIEAEGIDCRAVQRVEGVTSAIAAVIVDRRGETIIIPYYPPALFVRPQLPDGVERGAYAAVMSDVRWPQAGELALGAAKRAGTRSVLDADVAKQDVLETLAPLATHVVASARGAAVLTGESDAAAAVRRLALRFAGEAVVTAGAEGSYWFDRASRSVRKVPAPRVEAVDTAAAGDVFHGAFTLALVEGRDMPAGLRFATAAAALKCTRPGGRLGAPGRTETEALAATID